MVGLRKYIIAQSALIETGVLAYLGKLTTIEAGVIIVIVCVYFGVNYKTGQRI